MKALPVELVLALIYAAFLVMVAGVLEWMARHVHRRSERADTTGFVYLEDLDRWRCPDGKHLHRVGSEQGARTVQYRAEAHHCNPCVFKFRCTHSNSGRMIEIRQDSWLESGLHRFHRGLSLALLTLAGMILALEVIRTQEGGAQWLPAIFLFVVGAFGVRLFRTFRTMGRPQDV